MFLLNDESIYERDLNKNKFDIYYKSLQIMLVKEYSKDNSYKEIGYLKSFEHPALEFLLIQTLLY